MNATHPILGDLDNPATELASAVALARRADSKVCTRYQDIFTDYKGRKACIDLGYEMGFTLNGHCTVERQAVNRGEYTAFIDPIFFQGFTWLKDSSDARFDRLVLYPMRVPHQDVETVLELLLEAGALVLDHTFQ